MKRLIKQKRGQFVIIAMLIIAMMIISIGALMHRAVTYYKHEPWEEYLTLIGSIEVNSRRLVELSLANYTHTQNRNILKNNLEKWQTDLLRIYPGREISLSYELANDSYNVYGANINYYLGLNHSWGKQESFSAANVTFTLNITSIGLTGYKFTAVALLNLTIIDVNNGTSEITVTLRGEDITPITNLKKDNFQVEGYALEKVTSRYDDNYVYVYIIKCQGTISTPVTVSIWDQRGIQVTAKK